MKDSPVSLCMKRGKDAMLHRRHNRFPEEKEKTTSEEDEGEIKEYLDPSLSRRKVDNDDSSSEMVLYSVAPMVVSIDQEEEEEGVEERSGNGTLLITTQRLVFVSHQLLVVEEGTEGWCWSPEDFTVDIHSMILHAATTAEPQQTPSIYCQFQDEERTIHVTLFPQNETDCQHIQQHFVAISQQKTNPTTSSTYEEATDEQREAMLERLDAVLTVPPELEIPSECEDEEEEELPTTTTYSNNNKNKKKRQHNSYLDHTSFVVEGQFEDAEG